MRILVLSDIHANLVALETVLGHAAGAYDAIWCLGDVVGYGPRPNECVDLIRARAELCVIGNHDWAALDRPGINVDDFNPHARHAILWTQEQLTAASRDYLGNLSDQPLHPVDSPSLLMTHASPREPVWEYILSPSIALENFLEFDEDICLVGHTHKPAIFEWFLQNDPEAAAAYAAVGNAAVGNAAVGNAEVGNVAVAGAGAEAPAVEGPVAEDEVAENEKPGERAANISQAVVTVTLLQPQPGVAVRLAVSPHRRLILNPGSVGQPRDNDARAAYAILDLERRTWRLERVAYPVELTQSQMRAARLPRRLIDRLSFGW